MQRSRKEGAVSRQYQKKFIVPVLDDPRLPPAVYYENIPLSVFCPAPVPNSMNAVVLFLYGGSKYASKDNYRPFVEAFMRYGYIAACLDYRGMRRRGKGSWIAPLWQTALHRHAVDAGFLQETLRERDAIPPLFYQTGLHTRVADAHAAITFLCEKFSPQRLIVCGYSMGGYIAACVSGDRRVSHLILLSPGAYHEKLRADKISFGAKFYETLHETLSWTNSDSFRLIRQYKRPLYILGFENDAVVPQDIVHTYLYSSAGAKNDYVHYDYLPGDHGLSGRADKQHTVADRCLQWLARYYQ